MSNRLRDLEYQTSLNLERIEIKDTVGQMVSKINKNFQEVINNGGGPVDLRVNKDLQVVEVHVDLPVKMVKMH